MEIECVSQHIHLSILLAKTGEDSVEQAAQTVASADPSVQKRANLQTTILIVVAIGVIIGLVFTMVMRGTPVSCPDELIGAWETSARGYEEGMLVITKNAVVFSAGTEHLDGQAIRRLEATSDGLRTLYTVVYGDSRSEEQILSFSYHAHDQTITFKNQPHLIWRRKTVES